MFKYSTSLAHFLVGWLPWLSLAASLTLAATLSPNSTSPVVVSFDIDESTGLISFNFNIDINAASFNSSRVYLQGLSLGPAYNHLTLQGNTSSLQFYMLDDVYASFMVSTVGLTPNDTYISYDSQAFYSAYNLSCQALTPNQAIQVRAVSPDQRQPFVKSFVLDMNLGLMSLTFSEPVNASRYLNYCRGTSIILS